MKKIILIFSLSFLFGTESGFDISGHVNFSYISRLSNNSIINIPYRLSSIDIVHQKNNISLFATLALEYQIRDENYFLESKNPQDFLFDLRELYTTFSSNLYEFKIGKQIHSWGNVDDNSPLDNASAIDYYYIFFAGKERKIATFSTALDLYFGNLKLQTIISPLHNTNRLPIGNDDFPVELPLIPKKSNMMPIKGLGYEKGLYASYPFNYGEFSLSYFSGYDRIFNLSGVNVYGKGSDLSFTNIDILYGYRKTETYGLGAVLLHSLFNIRFDIGYFSTQDMNDSTDFIQRESINTPTFYDSLHFSYPLKEKSDYIQKTFQIESELPFNINLIAQYFTHDTLSYSSDSLPVDQEINIPNLEIDPDEMTPSNFFTPGLGVPLAFITNKAMLFSLNKNFLNNQLKLSLTTMLDINTYNKKTGVHGSLNEFKAEYDIVQDFIFLLGITKINGSNNHPDGNNYRFNKMEDFSHLRLELKYFF